MPKRFARGICGALAKRKRWTTSQTANDPEGGILSGSLEVLGRFGKLATIKVLAGEVFRLISPNVSIVSSAVSIR